MSEPCISIKRIWSDMNCIELELMAQNADIKAKIKFYVSDEQISDLSKGLSMFPGKIDDIFEWEVGSKENNSSYYVRLKLFIYDKKGHAAIETEIVEKPSNRFGQSSKFYITTEIESINVFGRNVKRLLEEDNVIVEGIYYLPLEYFE